MSTPIPQVPTQRLVLRDWRESDLAPFAALNADPEVMQFFPRSLAPRESDALVARVQRGWAAHGYGLWAVEVVGGAAFIGFVGLAEPTFQAHFTPAVEVGWRLARPFWGRGYATEAARAALEFGFEELGLTEIVSFTSAINLRSRAAMERIGMSRDPNDDFDHPTIAEGDPLRRHVLYRLTCRAWKPVP